MTSPHPDRATLLEPLRVIVGASEHLLASPALAGREQVSRDLRSIHEAGVRLRALVDRALDPATPRGPVDSRAVRHELYTPLNHIIGYADLLLEEATADTPAAFVADVERLRAAAREALALITTQFPPMTAEPAAADWGEVGAGRQAPAVERGSLLVVDDDPSNRDILVRHLTRQGHEALVATNGRQALEVLTSARVDVILLDLLMPEMDGYTTLKHLKVDPELRDIPVVVISALDEIDGVIRCIEIGAEDYLQKPFNPVLLNARIGACLGRKRLRDREVMYLQSRVFQRTAHEVQARQERLDALVAERTRDLQEKNAKLELTLIEIEKLLGGWRVRAEGGA